MSAALNALRRLRTRALGLVLGCGLLVGPAALQAQAQQPSPAQVPKAQPPSQAQKPPAQVQKAIFAGGCFWCVEADFDKVPGVLATVSGYIGGTVPNPTYEQVSRKLTGHAEAVEISFDPTQVSYERLLAYFWRTIDPTVRDRQFCDAGSPYRTAIFAVGDEQLRIARASLAALEKSRPFRDPIVTPVLPATTFYPAEDYHQDYYKRNPVRYEYYRTACGRDARLRQLWGEEAGRWPPK